MAMKKAMAAAAGAVVLTLGTGGIVLAAPGLPGLPGLPGGAARGGGNNQRGADGADGVNGGSARGGNGGTSGKTGQGGKGAPGGAGARGGDTIIRGQGAANNVKRRAANAHKHGRAEDPQPTNGFDF
jgi:hypothetical protein